MVADLLQIFDDTKEIKRIQKGEAFVRFRLVTDDPATIVPWRDKVLVNAWQNYYLPRTRQALPQTIDYLTGKVDAEVVIF